MEYCDSDKSGCLTWAEVEECFKKTADFLPSTVDITALPTQEDFYEMAGEDECLSFGEWFNWWNPFDKDGGVGIEEDE